MTTSKFATPISSTAAHFSGPPDDRVRNHVLGSGAWGTPASSRVRSPAVPRRYLGAVLAVPFVGAVKVMVAEWRRDDFPQAVEEGRPRRLPLSRKPAVSA